MTTRSRLYEGKWRILPNLSANNKGSIHDDEEARLHGFRRAIVGGPTVGQALMPAIADRLGGRWIESGWLALKFVGPVYPDEDVREVAEPAGEADVLDVRIETREERVALVGRAGLGATTPWDPSADGGRNAGAAFPTIPLGHRLDDSTFVVEAEQVARVCDSAGDPTPWFRGASPWGGPVVPPMLVFNPSLAPHRYLAEGTPVHPAGMNAEFHLVMERPLFQGERYHMTCTIVDKGAGASTWFWTAEFRISDGAGNHCMTGRQKLKWFVNE